MGQSDISETPNPDILSQEEYGVSNSCGTLPSFSEEEAKRILAACLQFSERLEGLSGKGLKGALRRSFYVDSLKPMIKWYLKYENILAELNSFKKKNRLTGKEAEKQLAELFDLKLNDKKMKEMIGLLPDSFRSKMRMWLENITIPDDIEQRNVIHRLAKRLRPYFYPVCTHKNSLNRPHNGRGRA